MSANNQQNTNIELEAETEKQTRSNSLIKRFYNELKQINQKHHDNKLFSFLNGPEGAGSYGGVYIVPQYTFVRRNSTIQDNRIVLENHHQHHHHHRHEIKV